MDLGDIHWVEFPPRGGHAQAGRRPAIIFQDRAASDRLPTALLVPLTTQQDALRFPGTVLIEPDVANGLRHPSVALVFQLTAIDRRFLGARLGRASQGVIEAIWTALDELLGRASSPP